MSRTIAMLVPTLSWSWEEDEVVSLQPVEARRETGMEAMRWQELSAVAASAELFAYPVPMRRTERWNGVEHVIEAKTGTPPREQNRLLEVHGLMGAIGEQLAMAWTAEQDAQRVSMTANSRDELTNRLMLRAQSELIGHFVLGATHSLANLVLRILTLNQEAAESLQVDYKVEAFPPGSDERSVWPTFGSKMAQRLRRAARACSNPSMGSLADRISELRVDGAYSALEGRRGMDYHRRRPQSVAHTAPRGGTVRTADGQTTLKMVAPRLEHEASARDVHEVAVAALESLARSMREIRQAMPEAVRSEGINYVYDFNPAH